VSGTLPPGLTLSKEGVISGTPTSVGTSSFTVRVTDSASPAQTADKAFQIKVDPEALQITTPSALPGATVNQPYTTTLQATGGTTPYTWSVLSGTLPPGFTLLANGTIQGTATGPGTFVFTAQVSDSTVPSLVASREFSLTVYDKLAVTTETLPDGTAAVPYSVTLAAAGGTPPFTWSLSDGTLPPGLTLSSAGVLSGTPTATGTFTFTVRVTDSSSPLQTADKQFVVTIYVKLAVATSTLPRGTVGKPYSHTLQATGGKPSYTWSLAPGSSLPPGLSLGGDTGVLTGTPTSPGFFNFTVRVGDSAVPPQVAEQHLAITVEDALAITTPSPLPDAVKGTAYSQTLQAAGGTAPFTWSLVPGSSLPAGLSLGSNTGLITGTPTVTGTFTFTVRVTDSSNTVRVAEKAFQLSVYDSLAITTASPLPEAAAGQPYSQSLSAVGGKPPYNWSLAPGSSALPGGLNLGSNGVISGTPSAAGDFTFTVLAADAASQSATKTFLLKVTPPGLAISTEATLPNGLYGSPYSQTLQATGGSPPYSWTVEPGSTLPEGLSLSTGGTLGGTPVEAGAFAFTIRVTDSASRVATQLFRLTIQPPALPPVRISGLPDPVDAASQPQIQLSLDAAYPLAVSGDLTLTFEPDAVNPADDPAVQFSTGGRKVNFTIAANATQAAFPGGALSLQTGTVAGTIRLTARFAVNGTDVTPSTAPSSAGRVLRAAPVIRRVQVARTASGFEVTITAFSTPREINQATFRFTPASGSTLQTTSATVPLSNEGRAWYQGETSKQYGSQCTLTLPFTVQGSASSVAGVSVTLSNGLGTSTEVSANF